MKERKIAIVCGTALLIAAAVAVVVAARNRQQSAPPTEVPVVQTPAEVRFKAVERKADPVESIDIDAAKFPNRKQMRASAAFGTLSRETR